MKTGDIDIGDLRAVAFREKATDRIVIHGLDRSICASGDNMVDAMLNFNYMVCGFAAIAKEYGTLLFDGIGQAPEKYLAAYAAAEQNGVSAPQLQEKEFGQLCDAFPIGDIGEGQDRCTVYGRFEVTLVEDPS